MNQYEQLLVIMVLILNFNLIKLSTADWFGFAQSTNNRVSNPFALYMYRELQPTSAQAAQVAYVQEKSTGSILVCKYF